MAAGANCSEEESWYLAEVLVRSLGPPSSMFSGAIRTIRSAPSILKTTEPKKLQRFAIDATHLLIKVSPTLKATFYFAAEELEEDNLVLSMPLTPVKLIELFTPEEISSILALTYLYRQVRKRCDADEWERVEPKLAMHMTIGALVGANIPDVGRGHGMLIGAVRILAMSILMLSHMKGYKELRRKLDSQKKLFDCKLERGLFGCDHLQVASCLISSIGFGVGPRLAFGLNSRTPTTKSMQEASEECQEEITAWRQAILCTESLHANRTIPDQYRGLFSREIQEILHTHISSIVSHGSGFKWLFCRSDSLSEEISDQLKISSKRENSALAEEVTEILPPKD